MLSSSESVAFELTPADGAKIGSVHPTSCAYFILIRLQTCSLLVFCKCMSSSPSSSSREFTRACLCDMPRSLITAPLKLPVYLCVRGLCPLEIFRTDNSCLNYFGIERLIGCTYLGGDLRRCVCSCLRYLCLTVISSRILRGCQCLIYFSMERVTGCKYLEGDLRRCVCSCLRYLSWRTVISSRILRGCPPAVREAEKTTMSCKHQNYSACIDLEIACKKVLLHKHWKLYRKHVRCSKICSSRTSSVNIVKR